MRHLPFVPRMIRKIVFEYHLISLSFLMWLFIIEGVGVVGGVGRVVAGYGSRSSDDGGSDTVHLKDLDMLMLPLITLT